MFNAGILSYTWYLVLFDLPLQLLGLFSFLTLWTSFRFGSVCSCDVPQIAVRLWLNYTLKSNDVDTACIHMCFFSSFCSNYNNNWRLRSLSKVSSVSKQYQLFFLTWTKRNTMCFVFEFEHYFCIFYKVNKRNQFW